MTDLEKLKHSWYDKYKEKEYNIYKEFHKVVLNDFGEPKYKKTAFRMPGYRKIIGNKDFEYTIDNNMAQQVREM